ncbi:PTS lactose/cellobiose transporter subunit IIA [Salibacterium aidingense]|uniref:PTS lactose/cellobiose transporter subunit IIA n=1 Tax=Salibacterium aidingense TaxID=384933 RepID=UPI003BD88117
MEGMEKASFQMITSIGTARSNLMEALELARKKEFNEAKDKIQEADHHLTEGHHGHTGLIQKEANGEQIPFSLLFMHAEDQLMTTYLLRDIAQEMVNMYEVMYYDYNDSASR